MKELSVAGHTSIGDDVGFAPNPASNRDALDFIMTWGKKVDYEPVCATCPGILQKLLEIDHTLGSFFAAHWFTNLSSPTT